MSTPTRRLVVCGGSGFLGSRICKVAAQRSWAVTSLSRSGEPSWPTLGLQSPPAWAKTVSWRRADVLDPTSYRDALRGADAVVHSLGILLEADYKGVLSGKEPLLAGLKRAFDSTRGTGGNTVREGKGALSYETMNRDTAVTLAEEAAAAGGKTFLYVSAIDGSVVLPSRYISTKREAEARIAAIKNPSNPSNPNNSSSSSSTAEMRKIYLRPSFLYDTTRALTVPLAGLMGVTSAVNSLFGRKLPLMGAAGYRPLQVEDVAAAAVKALEEDEVSGVVDVDRILELKNRVWREEML